jgi:BirA family biotin operon repressor/biotin-[acetyl-CoA-carboxylase] ligase
MDEARYLSREEPYGLVYADEQSAGRGRLPGRSWQGQAGRSLLVTLWFPAGEFGQAPLPLITGIALVRACQSWAGQAGTRFGTAPLLKWPNDVICGAHKLAGILCESHGATVYAGIGLNCGQTSFPSGYRTEPTSIRLQTGIAPEPSALLAPLLAALFALRGAADQWESAYASMLAWAGEPVTFRPGIDETPVTGTMAGVDHSGSVLINTVGGTIAFPSGELELRY